MGRSAASPPPPANAGSRPGRPRSDAARRAILDAAVELLERDGWNRLTMEGIAAAAAVSKATIYRWWPSRAAVLMDAMVERSGSVTAFPDTGSAIEDIHRQMRSVIGYFNHNPAGRALVVLIAESQHDPDLANELRKRLVAGRRTSAHEVIARGIERGELRDTLDPGVAIDAIYGALYYRLLVSHERTTPKYADTLLSQLRPALLADAT